jgi:hypothetical protein
MKTTKKYNHLYPALHIRKWQSLNGKIYDKDSREIRDIHVRDFTQKYYYSLGKRDDALENRIQVFEAYIGKLIKIIDQANDSVYLTGKDIEILKLYCALSVSRQHHTSEVVLSDESGFYKSNNYLFGTHKSSTQNNSINSTKVIMDDFEKLKSTPNDKQFCQTHRIMDPNTMGSVHTLGTHLCIIRNNKNGIIVSDRCSIIENTMDGDHLYSYIPISPSSALLLVKSKYYLSEDIYYKSISRLARKHGAIKPDRYMSVIFGDSSKVNHENALFCSYYRYKSNVHVDNNVFIESLCYKSAHVRIIYLPCYIFRQFNGVFYQDGKKILYINNDDLEKAKTAYLDYRHITIKLNF